MPVIESSLEITISDLSLDVYYSYTPGRPASLSCPAEPEELEITGIYLSNCEPKIDIIDLLFIDIEAELLMALKSQEPDLPCEPDSYKRSF